MKRILGTLGIALLSMAAACTSPQEGERCNPLLFNDECSAGLSCTYPANCGVAFCCVVDSDGGITSKSANCRACPAPAADAAMTAPVDASAPVDTAVPIDARIVVHPHG